MRDYKGFIQKHFNVLDKETQQPIPFVFNKLQSKYYDLLLNDYPKLEGTREIVLKARQEGISSLVLALFTVDFIMIPFSISICISHRRDATELLFKRVKFFIESYCQTNGMDAKLYLKTDNKNMLENSTNNALFYILTAGAKVGGRGGFAKNLHFSEVGFFTDTDLITASEMVTATAQQVPQGKGMIFLESTGNTDEDYYGTEWGRAERGQSTYKPRFFGWEEFYTAEEMEKRKKDFPDERKFMREYPRTSEEAFLASGTAYFDTLRLQKMLDAKPQPIFQGRIAPNGELM